MLIFLIMLVEAQSDNLIKQMMSFFFAMFRLLSYFTQHKLSASLPVLMQSRLNGVLNQHCGFRDYVLIVAAHYAQRNLVMEDWSISMDHYPGHPGMASGRCGSSNGKNNILI